MQSDASKTFSKIFAALTDLRRLEVLKALRSGPLTVGRIIERLGGGIPDASMRRCLVKLEDAGLVYRSRSNLGDVWCLKKEAFLAATSCLAQFTDPNSTADAEHPSYAFAGRASRILENKRLLFSENRQKLLIAILEGPADVASLHVRFERKISKRSIFEALSAFESEGLVVSRKVSLKRKAGASLALEFTATDFAREVVDYMQAKVRRAAECNPAARCRALPPGNPSSLN